VDHLTRLELAQPLDVVVPVRELNSPASEKAVRLYRTFQHHMAAACEAVGVAGAAKLYIFSDRTTRLRIDESNFLDYASSCLSGCPPVLFVFASPSGDSPEESQCSFVDADEGGTEVVSKVSGMERGSTRSSTQQSSFRHTISLRDGDSCVLCDCPSSMRDLEAAHIILRDEKDAVVLRYGLASSWDVKNGFLLCTRCHDAFDAFLWYVDDKMQAVVADAVLADEPEHWVRLKGKHLRIPSPTNHGDSLRLGPEFWPDARTLLWRREQFVLAQTKRHALDLSGFPCSMAGCTFEALSKSGLKVDQRSRRCPFKGVPKTPAKATIEPKLMPLALHSFATISSSATTLL
jgi:hypothetical protein